MVPVRTSRGRATRAARSKLPRMAAIAALVGCTLALGGPPMRAGALGDASAARDGHEPARRPAVGRPSGVAITERVRDPLAGLPGHSAELAGLLALGLSLLGAGRYMRRTPSRKTQTGTAIRARAAGQAPRSLAERLSVRISAR